MSYKASQLSPPSTPDAKLRVSIQGPWGSPSPKYSDMRFLRSWLSYDSELDDENVPRKVKRNMLLGMVLVLAISAGFWTAVGFIVAQVWK